MLKSRLPLIASQLRPRVEAAVKLGAEGMAEGARERVRVRSGALHDAIHVERRGPAEYAVVAGDENTFHGHLLEHGTSHSAPFPFLIPAFEEGRDATVALVVASLRGL